MNETVTNVKLSELPAPINKSLEFTKEGINFRFSVTDNILIPGDDKTMFFLNIYKEYIKIVGQAVKGDKRMRLESGQLLKKDFNSELWQYWLERLIKTAEEKLGK